MHASERADDLVARAEMEVVGIREHHLASHCRKLGGIECFHGRDRADGHERWRLDGTMRCCEDTGARGAVGRETVEREAHALVIAAGLRASTPGPSARTCTLSACGGSRVRCRSRAANRP